MGIRLCYLWQIQSSFLNPPPPSPIFTLSEPLQKGLLCRARRLFLNRKGLLIRLQLIRQNTFPFRKNGPIFHTCWISYAVATGYLITSEKVISVRNNGGTTDHQCVDEILQISEIVCQKITDNTGIIGKCRPSLDKQANKMKKCLLCVEGFIRGPSQSKSSDLFVVDCRSVTGLHLSASPPKCPYKTNSLFSLGLLEYEELSLASAISQDKSELSKIITPNLPPSTPKRAVAVTTLTLSPLHLLWPNENSAMAQPFAGKMITWCASQHRWCFWDNFCRGPWWLTVTHSGWFFLLNCPCKHVSTFTRQGESHKVVWPKVMLMWLIFHIYIYIYSLNKQWFPTMEV